MSDGADVRRALLEDRPEALETVRRWVAGLVFGGNWGLSDAESAVQEVILRILTLARAGRIRAETNFKSFVLTVARHTCIDLYRRESLRTDLGASDEGIDHEPASAAGPEAELLAKERKELLMYVFQALPEPCRRLWSWVYGEGLGAAEVAARLDITPGNARVRVHRCLEQARRISREYMNPGRPEGRP